MRNINCKFLILAVYIRTCVMHLSKSI